MRPASTPSAGDTARIGREASVDNQMGTGQIIGMVMHNEETTVSRRIRDGNHGNNGTNAVRLVEVGGVRETGIVVLILGSALGATEPAILFHNVVRHGGEGTRLLEPLVPRRSNGGPRSGSGPSTVPIRTAQPQNFRPILNSVVKRIHIIGFISTVSELVLISSRIFYTRKKFR